MDPGKPLNSMVRGHSLVPVPTPSWAQVNLTPLVAGARAVNDSCTQDVPDHARRHAKEKRG